MSSYSDVTFIKRRLAAPIKEAVCALYGFTPDQVEGPEKELYDPVIGTSPRAAMVHLTKTIMQENGIDFFSKRLFRDIDARLWSKPIIHIIPDVRYAHDLEEIRRRGGIVIKICRDTCVRHAWEDPIDDLVGDITITNNGSLEDLRTAVLRSLPSRT
jgi:hypothetical protein